DLGEVTEQIAGALHPADGGAEAPPAVVELVCLEALLVEIELGPGELVAGGAARLAAGLAHEGEQRRGRLGPVLDLLLDDGALEGDGATGLLLAPLQALGDLAAHGGVGADLADLVDDHLLDLASGYPRVLAGGGGALHLAVAAVVTVDGSAAALTGGRGH